VVSKYTLRFGRLSHSAADIIFSKVCGAGAKTVGYVDFKWCLNLAAEVGLYKFNPVDHSLKAACFQLELRPPGFNP
jgi:hypothetical protein